MTDGASSLYAAWLALGAVPRDCPYHPIPDPKCDRCTPPPWGQLKEFNQDLWDDTFAHIGQLLERSIALAGDEAVAEFDAKALAQRMYEFWAVNDNPDHPSRKVWEEQPPEVTLAWEAMARFMFSVLDNADDPALLPEVMAGCKDWYDSKTKEMSDGDRGETFAGGEADEGSEHQAGAYDAGPVVPRRNNG